MTKFKDKMNSYKKHPGSFLLLLLVVAAAIITVAVLIIRINTNSSSIALSGGVHIDSRCAIFKTKSFRTGI